MAALGDMRLEDDQGGAEVRLTLANVKGLTAVLQAIKPGAKQVRAIAACSMRTACARTPCCLA